MHYHQYKKVNREYQTAIAKKDINVPRPLLFPQNNLKITLNQQVFFGTQQDIPL
jgi:hypothetical protein